jgi:Ner family transcriptional regulator
MCRSNILTTASNSEHNDAVDLRTMSKAPAAESSEGDWDRHHIIAELHRRGMSLRQLSFTHGYRRNTLRDALDRPYPKAESIIARALGTLPRRIWPSRYSRRRRSIKKAAPQ